MTTVAFSAKALQQCLTAPFILDYALQVLVQGFSIRRTFEESLPAFSKLGHHTDVVLLDWKEGESRGTRFVFTHKVIRPWGKSLPVQCPSCFAVRAWKSTPPPPPDGTGRPCLAFKCQGRRWGDDGWVPCEQRWEAYGQRDPEFLGEGATKTERWMVCPLDEGEGESSSEEGSPSDPEMSP